MSDSGRACTIQMPVTRVVCFEDRASIERAIEIDLPAGEIALHVPGVTPLHADDHLAARVDGLLGARVDDVRIERRWVAVADAVDEPGRAEAERDALRVARRAAEDRLEEAREARARAEQRREAAERLLGQYIARAGAAVWEGTPFAPATLDALESAADAATEAWTAAGEALADTTREHARLVALTAQGRPRGHRLEATLLLRIHSPNAGRARLVAGGLVPCALWRPAHEARLTDGQVAWTTRGTVWQRTGEAWTGVELELATERPGQGGTLPALTPDRLRARDKVERRRIVLDHREEAVSTDAGERAVPGVDDGGEPRIFRAEGRVDVPADGKPHPIAAGGFEAPAELSLVAVPEAAPQVFWRARLRNHGPRPLLAGPVTLVRDGAFVGTGDVGYVGAGESFELAFGSDDRFRVRLERRRELERRTLGKDRTHFVTHVEIDGTADRAERIEVVLRLPVSDVEALQIVPSDDRSSEGRPRPDPDGILRWGVEVPAGGRRALDLAFRFDAADGVVLADPW